MKKNNVITFAIMAAAVLYFAGGVASIRRQAAPAPAAPAVVAAAVTEAAPAEAEAKVTFMYQRPFDQTIQAARTYLFEVDPEMQVRFVGVAGENSSIAADAGVPFEVPEITALS